MEARAALAEHRPQSVAASLQQCTWIDYQRGLQVLDMGFPTEASLLKPLAEVEYYQNATEYWARNAQRKTFIVLTGRMWFTATIWLQLC